MTKFTKNNIKKKFNKEKNLVSSRDMLIKRKYCKKKNQGWKFLSLSEKQEIIETIQHNIKQDLTNILIKEFFSN